MDFSAIAASAAGFIAIAGAAASLYYRASSADMDKRLSIAEARILDVRAMIAANYDYCHKVTHETNGTLMQHYARLRVLEMALKVPVGHGEM